MQLKYLLLAFVLAACLLGSVHAEGEQSNAVTSAGAVTTTAATTSAATEVAVDRRHNRVSKAIRKSLRKTGNALRAVGKFVSKSAGLLKGIKKFDAKFLGGRGRLRLRRGPPSCKGLSKLECDAAREKYEANRRKLTDAPTGVTVKQLQKYTDRRVKRVIPSGPAPQLPGDREYNEDAIKSVKFDLRWAKSIKEKHIREAQQLVPKVDGINAKFRESQARNNRLPLIAPHLFNGR